MGKAQTQPVYPRGLDFEQVWAGIQELKESQKETDRLVKETTLGLKKAEKVIMENGRQIGGLHNSFGQLAEHLVAPGITRRFNELGFHFDAISPGGLKITNLKGDKTLAEIDLLLENSESIVAVEIKSKVNENDIDHHIKRLEILKENRDRKQEKPKKIMGAIAGAIFGSVEKKAAIEAGFYVLIQSGDTMKMELPKGFVPREW